MYHPTLDIRYTLLSLCRNNTADNPDDNDMAKAKGQDKSETKELTSNRPGYRLPQPSPYLNSRGKYSEQMK